jgi:hypothetical protein
MSARGDADETIVQLDDLDGLNAQQLQERLSGWFAQMGGLSFGTERVLGRALVKRARQVECTQAEVERLRALIRAILPAYLGVLKRAGLSEKESVAVQKMREVVG